MERVITVLPLEQTVFYSLLAVFLETTDTFTFLCLYKLLLYAALHRSHGFGRSLVRRENCKKQIPDPEG